MGFLTGAYGKLMAGKRVRSLTYQLTSISSRLNRVTREMQNKQKMYSAQERNMKNMMQMQMNQSIMSALGGAAMTMAANGDTDTAKSLGIYANMFGGAVGGGNIMAMMGQYGAMPTIGADGRVSSNLNTTASYLYSSIQQQVQMQFAQSNNLWQNMFEVQKEADLEALKDLEDELQTEKDSLETQLNLAREEYKAYKEQEKADVKNMVPDYTGQGG